MKYIVVSEKSGKGYYKMFDNEAEARDFLNTEEYDFCERTLYTDLFDRTDWQKKCVDIGMHL